MSEQHVLDPPRFSIANGTSLSDQVYAYLTNKIITGELKFGDRLNIKEIASRLQVSSMPIRDAIKRLEQDRVVVVNPRSTCLIRTPTKQDVLDAIDARRMIEHFAVELVHRHVRLNELSLLDSLLARMEPIAAEDISGGSADHLQEYIDLDREFHRELCNLSRNDYVRQFYTIVNIHLSMSFSYGCGVCHGASATYEEHRRLVEYLKAHSSEALDVIDSHLMKSRENIMKEPTFQTLPD
ncbi:GntR family transcriptional regulator [Marispirochaeta aestuarii]|uniref:GntR family transcriptional regulator n=1 Tax=Marispirochaeta aestuarii TaxID=1963862 RepID=UPI0029C8CD01|nr:GntR family transcriptional regulator [Marispirochaeta aestuarii]